MGDIGTEKEVTTIPEPDWTDQPKTPVEPLPVPDTQPESEPEKTPEKVPA